jgi:hypothetical protein
MSQNQKNWAIFSTADDRYIIPSIVALTSIRRFHPEAHYCILANESKIRAEKKILMDRFQIELVSCAGERIRDGGPWPSEAFLKLEAPEILFRRGFPFSLGVDGDTFCRQGLELEKVACGLIGYAGIKRPGQLRSNFTDPAVVRRIYGLSDAMMNASNTNTGVVFWNNAYVAETGFFAHCIRCYEECSRENSRLFVAADQSLFALASVLDQPLPWKVLELGYNYLCHVPEVVDLGTPRETVRVVHFSRKPWQSMSLSACRKNPLLGAYRPEWKAWVRELGCFDPDLRWRGFRSTRFARSVRFKMSQLRERVIQRLQSHSP